MTINDKSCAACKKDQSSLEIPLKFCAKCKNVQYCSKECQKDDWKNHKKACRPLPPRFIIDKPFTALKEGTWLFTRPEEDIYQLLIDVYRMRREDRYRFEGKVDKGCIYSGANTATALRHFRKYLYGVVDADAKQPIGKNMLPSWWSAESFEKCVQKTTTNEDAKIEYKVDKSAIQKFYKQDDMPMQLRMLGELLDGTQTGGQPCAPMLNQRAGLESSNKPWSMLNVNFSG